MFFKNRYSFLLIIRRFLGVWLLRTDFIRDHELRLSIKLWIISFIVVADYTSSDSLQGYIPKIAVQWRISFLALHNKQKTSNNGSSFSLLKFLSCRDQVISVRVLFSTLRLSKTSVLFLRRCINMSTMLIAGWSYSRQRQVPETRR